MKIAYVITRCDDLGGAQVHVRDMAMAVKKRGSEAVVFGGTPGVLSEQLEASGIPFIEVKALQRSIFPLKDISALKELCSKLKEQSPDLVSAHSSKAGVLARVAASRIGIPAVFTAHGWAFADGVPAWKRTLYRAVEKKATRFAKRIITVSEYDRRIALLNGVASESEVVAIHNGMGAIGAQSFADPSKQPPTFVTIARHDKQKDYATLLRAFSRVSKRHPDWRLICVGAGPLLEQNRALAAELGLGDRAQLLGFRSQPIELLAEAQAYLLITNWEGLPRSIIEAMRAGLPVIASDVGGVSEMVDHGQSGFLVARGDTGALERRLEELGSAPIARAAMGARGRESFEEEVRFDLMFDKTWAVYESVLGAGNA